MTYKELAAYVELHKLIFGKNAWKTPILPNYSSVFTTAMAEVKSMEKVRRLRGVWAMLPFSKDLSVDERKMIADFLSASLEAVSARARKPVMLDFRDGGDCWRSFKCLLESKMIPDSKYTLTEVVQLVLRSFTSYLQKWCKSKSMTMKDIEHIWMIRDEDMQVLWEKAWKYDDYIRRNPHMACNFCQDVPHDYEWIMDNVLDPEIGNMHGRWYGTPAPISKLSIVTEANPELVYKPEPTPQPAPQPPAPDSGKAPVTPTTSKDFSQLLHDIAPDPEPSTPELAPAPKPSAPQSAMLGVLNRAMAGVPKVVSEEYELITDEDGLVTGVLHRPSNQAIPLSNYAAFEKAKEENEYSEVFSSKDGEWVGIQISSGVPNGTPTFIPRPSTAVQWENV